MASDFAALIAGLSVWGRLGAGLGIAAAPERHAA